jgi:hypothetical protein
VAQPLARPIPDRQRHRRGVNYIGGRHISDVTAIKRKIQQPHQCWQFDG